MSSMTPEWASILVGWTILATLFVRGVVSSTFDRTPEGDLEYVGIRAALCSAIVVIPVSLFVAPLVPEVLAGSLDDKFAGTELDTGDVSPDLRVFGYTVAAIAGALYLYGLHAKYVWAPDPHDVSDGEKSMFSIGMGTLAAVFGCIAAACIAYG